MAHTGVSPDIKRDLQILKMRGILDPKRHYKKDPGSKLVPNQFQIGTVVQGSTEYVHGRIPNRDQKGTITSEVLAHEAIGGRLRQKYNEIQSAKIRGKKLHYKKLRAQRLGKARTQ